MPTLTPQDFVSKWKRVTSREKQTYQEHLIDLCHLVWHQTQMKPTQQVLYELIFRRLTPQIGVSYGVRL